jgi:4-alpha-glucanotransferase
MILNNKIRMLASIYGVDCDAKLKNIVSILQAMDVLPKEFDIDDADSVFSNTKLLNSIIIKHKDAEFSRIVHQVSVIRENKTKELIISLPEHITELRWTLNTENKSHYMGRTNIKDLPLVYKDNGEPDEHTIGDINYRKYKFSFPFELNMGYHQVLFSYKDPINNQTIEQESRIISAPEKCYDGIGIYQGNKTWGVPVQLYEQVSENNLGIGNFSDLAQLGNILGRNGAGIIGVNPLHAMCDDYPENASPYSPDCRTFYNYIYLDVTALKEFKESPEIRDYYYSQEFQKRINKNKRKGYVDYAVTQELVDDILKKCYNKFSTSCSYQDRLDFDRFCRIHGEDLTMYATFRAICKHLSQQKPAPTRWEQWPEEYRHPESPAVKKFQEEHKDLIGYYKYNQWQCTLQLEQVKRACLSSGMKIGLYTDMAVGCTNSGFESWCYKDLYINATAGAPVDVLSQNGQNWQLLGFNPLKLREKGYEPYRKIISASMKYAGCTRIDHVLQLQRLFMIPKNCTPADGAFVSYNPDELMAIVALESHKNKTMVIGEDLGVLPNGFREKLEDFGILSYRVLPFEREWGYQSGHGSNAMKHPEEYPCLSVCATSTHDTPPLACQWNVQDVYQKHKLGVITNDQADKKFEQYATQREALNYALEEKGCWRRVGGSACMHPRQDAAKIPEKYTEAVMDYLGQSNSVIMLVPFSDIFETKEMGNIPGVAELAISEKETLNEINMDLAYPNWRKKMHIPIEHIENVPRFKEVVKILNRYRDKGIDERGKYYQFQRLGDNNPSSIDFDHYYEIYKRIKENKAFTQEEIIKHRYSKERCDHLRELTAEQNDYFEKQKKEFDAFMMAKIANDRK